MMKTSRPLSVLLCGLPLLMLSAGTAFEPGGKSATQEFAAEKAALEEFNSLIGGWRGVGMPRRGSSRGAWFETADWVWDFQKNSVGLRYVVKNGKLLTTARLTFDAKTKEYVLRATFADKKQRTYRGRLKDGILKLVSPAEKDGASYRITITRLNDKRTLVLHENRRNQKSQFFRIAEVGYTRQGTSIAETGTDLRECVVTGGKGTIRVSYQGKTYYVCCSGCKQAFDEDPAGILAEYRQRLAERKKNRPSSRSAKE